MGNENDLGLETTEGVPPGAAESWSIWGQHGRPTYSYAAGWRQHQTPANYAVPHSWKLNAAAGLRSAQCTAVVSQNKGVLVNVIELSSYW